MRVIGVTGGVGAGKSTVLEFLRSEYDACIIQADLVGHEVMEPGQKCYDAVVALFGTDVIKNDKTIDRKLVSDVVFAEADKREALNQIIHPAVKEEILARIERAREERYPLCVVEAALLLEDHYQEFLHEVWVVTADREVRIQRLMKSRGYSREKALSIMRSQASEEFYLSHAQVVINNSGTEEETRCQIRGRLKKL